MLAGKKTYILGVVGLLYAWIGYWGGLHSMDVAVEMTQVSLTSMGIRSGISAASKLFQE